MKPTPSTAPTGKTGYEKAAILLVTLESRDSEVTTKILEEMGKEKAKDMIRAISELGKVSQDEINAVVDEFFEHAVEQKYLYGGKDISAKLLQKSFGIVSDDVFLTQEMRFFDFLDKVDDDSILAFFAEENMQARGLILHYMPDDRVASLFAKMPTDETKLLSQVLLGFEVPNPNLLWAYHQHLKNHFFDDDNAQSASEQQYLQKLARVLENIADEPRQEILQNMRESHTESAEKLEKLIFTFDNLVEISNQDLEMILYEVEQIKVLAVALKGASSELLEKVQDNISDRIKLILEEEIDTLPELEISEVQDAQREVMRMARRLEKEGKIKPLRVKLEV